MKHYLALVPIVAFLCLPVRAGACSLVGCVGNGIETRKNFIVRVTIDGKPVAGVIVQVKPFGNEKTEGASGTTSADGTVHVPNLKPGTYWLSTDLLGISAGGQCFHVGAHASLRAKRRITYEWADSVPATRKIAGRLIDQQPGVGESPILNAIHRVDVPIRGAEIKLRDPWNGKVHAAVSDDNGKFAFDPMSPGLYVLHIDSGTATGGHNYDSTDIQIRLSNTAKVNAPLLKSSGGGCDGMRLELHPSSNPL